MKTILKHHLSQILAVNELVKNEHRNTAHLTFELCDPPSCLNVGMFITIAGSPHQVKDVYWDYDKGEIHIYDHSSVGISLDFMKFVESYTNVGFKIESLWLKGVKQT